MIIAVFDNKESLKKGDYVFAEIIATEDMAEFMENENSSITKLIKESETNEE